jgi:hypothetical protein
MLHFLYSVLEVVECIFDDHTPVKRATPVKVKRSRERTVGQTTTGRTGTAGVVLVMVVVRWLVIIGRIVYHKSTSMSLGRNAGRRIPARLSGGLMGVASLLGRCRSYT